METMTKRRQKQLDRIEGKAYILSLLEGEEKPTIYTIIRSVSASGMSRQISLKVVKEGRLYDISFSVAKVLDYPLVQKAHNAVRVSGCGMDMGFHIVSSLSRVLYGDDYKIRQEWA